MSLREQPDPESRAKIFNSYFGSLANLVIPVLVVIISVTAGIVQHAQDVAHSNLDREISQNNLTASTKRECLTQMRETAKMLTADAKANQAAYEAMTVSVAASLNEVCQPVGVSLPQVLVDAAQKLAADPTVPPTEKAAAKQVINSQFALRVYFQVGDEAQRAEARSLELKLEDQVVENAPVIVPGIERVKAAPDRNELRYANAADKVQAQALAKLISQLLGGAPVDVKKIPGVGVQPRTFEFWMAKA